MEQETTLEEAAELYSKNISTWTKIRNNSIRDFIEGAKWQQERSYSEEEIKSIARDAYSVGRYSPLIGVFDKWFKQFKKK